MKHTTFEMRRFISPVSVRSTLIFLAASFAVIDGSELMFELPDNEKMCFHEILEKGVKCSLEFQASLISHCVGSV